MLNSASSWPKAVPIVGVVGDAVAVLVVAEDQRLDRPRAAAPRSSVKSCFTRTAPPWNVMIATRSGGCHLRVDELLRRARTRASDRRAASRSGRSRAPAAGGRGTGCRPAATARRSAPASAARRARRRRRRRGDRRPARERRAAAGALGSRWNSTKLIVCGSPSSVTMKSFAVSPSIGLPSLSFTVTVCTISRVAAAERRRAACCAGGCADEQAAAGQRTAATRSASLRPLSVT